MRKMGSADGLRHPMTGRPPITAPLVAFDFDGTLTARDSLIAFLAWRAGFGGAMIRGAALLAPALAYAWRRDRGRLKSAMIRSFLGGVSLDTARDDARRFARDQAPRLLRPDALAAWKAWRDRGAHLVIVTASPEFLVSPFGDALGAERVIGTRLTVDADGRITGALDGANCRGTEKVRRLTQAFGAPLDLAAAYGDTGGDAEMLAAARETGFRVFKGRP
jgi:phosphatidylglycerophosphatase C